MEPAPTDGGGGTTLFASNVPPGAPLPPPVSPEPPPTPGNEGGGGTTLAAPKEGAFEAEVVSVPVPPEMPLVGGGAMTLEPRGVPTPLRLPLGSPRSAFTLGGGGTTCAASAGADLLPLELTDGGGGTTSLEPKILPIKLLTNDPLVGCVGGGGTTALDGSGIAEPDSLRESSGTLAEGGGAITGAGRFSFAVREFTRSGAEAGGGTIATFAVCTGERVSRLITFGAGGITLELSAGAVREPLEETVGAGATIEVWMVGTLRMCSRETLGAGGMTDDPSAGATRRWSSATFGAGGTTCALKFGAARKGSRGTEGVGAITASS